ncbi:hypothetical protein BJV74DRAFT_799066 [Russula compacta]|nr:hypothetical protein BJV74DRAFT_799066 [Russula compacta]
MASVLGRQSTSYEWGLLGFRFRGRPCFALTERERESTGGHVLKDWDDANAQKSHNWQSEKPKGRQTVTLLPSREPSEPINRVQMTVLKLIFHHHPSFHTTFATNSSYTLNHGFMDLLCLQLKEKLQFHYKIQRRMEQELGDAENQHERGRGDER